MKQIECPNNLKTKILSGGSDEVYSFQKEDNIYILSYNFRYGYTGLQIFNKDNEIANIFLQGDDYNEVFGNREVSPKTMVKMLIGFSS